LFFANRVCVSTLCGFVGHTYLLISTWCSVHRHYNIRTMIPFIVVLRKMISGCCKNKHVCIFYLYTGISHFI
jgi:hypothetical protein